MPEENKNQGGAQNKLGELFVEFSTKGLPSLLKNLNSVQTNFLLGKKAAEEFVKPIVNMSQKATQGVTGLAKFNAVTGLTIKQLNEIQTWAGLNNVSFDELIGNVKTLQQNLLEISMGKGNVKGFNLLGLDPRQLDYKKPLEAWGKIRERILQVDEAVGVLALKELGFSENMRYAMMQQNDEYSKRLLLNEQEAENLKQQQELWNKLGVTWNNIQTKFIANQKYILDLLNKTSQAIDYAANTDFRDKKTQYELADKALAKTGKFLTTRQFPDAHSNGIFYRGHESFSETDPEKMNWLSRKSWSLGQWLAGYVRYKATGIVPAASSNGKSSEKTISSPTKNISPFQLEVIPDNELPIGNGIDPNNILPPKPDIASASTSANAQITVTQYITGENAELIAQRSADKIEDTLTTLTVQNTWMV